MISTKNSLKHNLSSRILCKEYGSKSKFTYFSFGKSENDAFDIK